MDEVFTFARTVFEAQPFSVFIGASLTKAAPGLAEIVIPVDANLKQQHGFVHGGVISYLADNAIAFAGGLALDGNVVVSEFKINYLKPGRGSRLIARAQAKGAGKRQAVCVCEIYDVVGDEQQLCAIAQGTVMTVGAATPVAAG